MKDPKNIVFLFLILTVAFACNFLLKNKNTDDQTVVIHKKLDSLKFDTYDFKTPEFCYDYEVIGIDENGNIIHGNINLEGEYGEGRLDNTLDNPEINIVIESINDEKLLAIDTDGNKYYLEIK